MTKPSDEPEVSDEQLLQQMPPWLRVLLKFLVMPLVRAGCFLETLVRTRWEIVPLDDSLLVEVNIKPSDIAFLHPGESAMLKITAYDYSIYGGLKGKVSIHSS